MGECNGLEVQSAEMETNVLVFLLLFPHFLLFFLIYENKPLMLVLNTKPHICENCGDLVHFG